MEDRTPQPCSDPENHKEVACRRVNRKVPVDEHKQCPYCFGKLDEIRSGSHETFCDYDPEKDPISFGFPADKGHFKES